MKDFIREIKSEWKPLKHWPVYVYSKGSIKWNLRNFFVRANRELVKTIGQLRDSPLTLLVCTFSVLVAYFAVNYVNRSDVASLLLSMMGLIATLVSVLIAAAIFISTLHQKNINRNVEEDMLFKKQLLKLKFTFSEAYEELKDTANDEDKIALFKAVPAASVSNYYDYQQFKAWHKEAIEGIDKRKIQPYERTIIYPYDMVMEMRGARTYYITEAAAISLRLLAGKDTAKISHLKSDIENLQAAAERYQTAGVHGNYVPTNFVGRHLIRIVVYCLLAMGTITAALLLQNYTADLFVYNFHIVNNVFFTSVILSILALFLILRHVFDFIKYLRDNVEYSGTMFDNFFIYDDDPSAKDPESPYPYG